MCHYRPVPDYAWDVFESTQSKSDFKVGEDDLDLLRNARLSSYASPLASRCLAILFNALQYPTILLHDVSHCITPHTQLN